MPRFFQTTRHIDAPVQRVWDVLFDVARWPEWTPTIKSVERLEDGPFQVGSRAEVRQPKLPRAVWEVTEVVDGQSFNKAWIGYGLTYSTVDDQRHPTEGLSASLTQRYVGYDYNFIKCFILKG